MKTALAMAIDVSAGQEKYDAACKRALSFKAILANIMRGCLDEYRDSGLDEVMACIEGEPQVGERPLMPDGGPAIRGLDTADKTLHEGSVYFDILFEALVPGKDERLGLIVNVEAQNDFHPGYPLVSRGVFYCARLLSAQGSREAAGAHYERLRKVCSIWICTEPPKRLRDTITRYQMAEEAICGAPGDEPRQNYDLQAVVRVCVGDPRHEGVLGMLGTLLAHSLGAREKKRILSEDYGIPMTEEFEREVDDMCDLGTGIWNKASDERAKALAVNFLSMGFPPESVAKGAELPLEEVMRLKEERERLAPK